MTDIQLRLLKMLKWFTRFLNEHNLVYYVCGGTLIGALRHNGFIPWDDDVDIVMPRDDYMKLVHLFDTDMENYRLETPYQSNKDYLYTYSKLYDTSTTLIERQRKPFKRGLFIDVFVLDGLANSFKEASKHFKSLYSKNMKLTARICAIRKERSFIKNMAVIAARLIPFFNDKGYSLKIDKLASKVAFNDCCYVGNISGSYGIKEIFEKRLFGTPREHIFEDIVVKIPEHSEELLAQIYGDWKKLPPINKRGVQHDFLFIDLGKSYLEEK